MTALFISHSAKDSLTTERVRDRLRAEGFSALFLDTDPQDGIPAGRAWEQELHYQLRKADGVVFLASPASVTSPWCFAELTMARALGKPVFPVRVEPGAELTLLDRVQWVDLAEGEPALARLLAGLRRAGLDPESSFSWDPARSPYPGLRAFESEDAAVFFGRDVEVHRLLELLGPSLALGSGRFVAVVGPSGSGKSSLVRAGLIPCLARRPEAWVVLEPLRVGSDPLRSLSRSIAAALAANGAKATGADVEADVSIVRGRLDRGAEGLAELAVQLAERVGAPGGELPNVLITVDQGEELFTGAGPRDQKAFLGLLRGCLRLAGSPLRVLVTLRSEYLTTSPDRAGLVEATDATLVLEPLSRARLPEVIALPAQRGGLTFAPGLAERMVEETSGGDALPMLAYTLSELSARAGPEGRVSTQDYEAVGGVIGALQRRADGLRDQLADSGLGDLVLPTLLRLAAIEGDGEPTRRRLDRRMLDARERQIVDAFVEARLITAGGGGSSDDGRTDEGWVEVAHEALLRLWTPLRQEIEGARESLRRRSELERLARDWEQGGRDESFLLRAGRLALFQQWSSGRRPDVGSLENEYLEASQAHEVRESEAMQRRNRQLRLRARGLGILLVVALAAGGLAWQRTLSAQEQTRLARTRQLAAESARLVDSDPDLAVLAGLQAIAVGGEPGVVPSGLVTAMARATHASHTLVGHRNQVHAVAFSPDGRLLASGGGDGTVRLWDVATHESTAAPKESGDEVWGVAFSPDGRLLASGGSDGTVRLWDVRTRQPHGTSLISEAKVWAVAFTPDSRSVLSAGDDGVIRRWDVGSGELLTAMHGHEGPAYSVAASRSGLVVSGGSDGTLRLWDGTTGRPRGKPMDQGDEVFAVAFSPDARLVASGGRDGNARLWEAGTGQAHGRPFAAVETEVRGLAFSPDGKLLATSRSDRSVVLWDVASGRPGGAAFIGHRQEVDGVAFSPDGRTLASAGWDGDVRLWDVPETPSVSRVLLGHPDGVQGLAFSPDGRALATAGADGAAQLWALDSEPPRSRTLLGHSAEVNAVAWSHDGRLVVTVDEDGVVMLWEPGSGRPHGPQISPTDLPLRSVAFSPDGRLLALGAGDGSVILWDVVAGAQRGSALMEHEGDVNGVAFSRDGSRLASASEDGTVMVWSVATGQRLKKLTGHTGAVYAVAFSPDGRLLASASNDKTIRLWDATSGEQQGPALTGHVDGVRSVAFSPDSRFLVSGGADRTVRRWEVSAGQPVGTLLTGHSADVTAVAFSPDGHVVASSSLDSSTRLWELGFSSWRQSGCTLVNRNMTLSEWTQLLPGVSYERTCPELPAGAS